jgi:hypothetical protein
VLSLKVKYRWISERAAQAGVSPFIEVVETNLAGCVSAPVNLPVTISELPTAVLSGDATVCFGKSTDLQIELSGAGPWELKYAANSGGPAVTNTISIPDAPTPHIYDLSVSPMVTTNYSLISVTDGSSNNCEAISVSGNAFVEVLPEPALNAGVNQSIAQGVLLPSIRLYQEPIPMFNGLQTGLETEVLTMPIS